MAWSDRPPKLRWPRSQRFSLSEQGAAAEKGYREQIVASRTESGRGSFNTARQAWAVANGLQADDGLYLAEVLGGGVSLAQIIESLETCGKTRVDAIAALERLADAGMLQPLQQNDR